MTRDFVLPDLGEGIAEAQIVRVLIKPGDQIVEDQYLMEVETDKAAVEIPSPYRGVAMVIHVKEGQTVNVGDLIVSFDEGDGTPSPAVARAAAGAKEPTRRPEPVDAGPQKPAETPVPRKTSVPAAPAVRRLAREANVDLETVAGTGPGGRITREDLERHVAKAAAQPSGSIPRAPTMAPTTAQAEPARIVGPPGIADTDKWGKIRRVPLNQIRKTIATQMSRSAFTIPHVTHCDEADITELDRIRRELNELTGSEPRLTPMSFLIRGICIALRKYPVFNVVFDEAGGQLIYKEYVNMGIAVDTERGLIVPVIRNADQLSLRGTAVALRTIADRIRANQFAIEDLRGGTFTVTNVGAFGGTFTTPIINHPEVAILALGRSRKVPVFREGTLSEALVLPLALSFDHRATDGASAARFMREIISYLEHPAKFLLN